MTLGKAKALFWRITRQLGSLKLAVITILALAVVSAVGTIVESRYNTEVAQKLVYNSIYMQIVMVMLLISLTASALTRWPWKKRHLGFLVVHLGLIILIAGSYVTQKNGIDGTMYFRIGESSNYVSLNDYELLVYYSMDGDSYIPLFEPTPADFLVDPPSKRKVEFPLGGKTLKVSDFIPFAIEKTEVRASERPQDGPGVRFQLKNDRVQVTEWVVVPGKIPQSYSLGPAQVTLARERPEPTGGNEILIWPAKKDRSLSYEIHTAREPGKVKKGQIRVGQELPTGWMGLEFRVLTYYPRARQNSEFQKLEKPTPLTRSAIQLQFGNENYWMGLNTILRLYDEKSVYIVTYGNRRLRLGFDIKLERFHMGTYQGTKRAMSYESEVLVPGIGSRNISMNEPLKHNGFTFYQASFEQDQTGQPIASILSVNWDPGRPIKYAGSLCVVLGTIIMFYTRRRAGATEAS